MNSLTLKHLRYFCALVDQRHFGRAAELCAISQPALSLQIKDLEAILEVPLLERGKRDLRLTPFGARFAERAARILQEVEDLSDLKRQFDGPFAGPMRLGVIPTIAPYLLPQVIIALAERFPNLEIAPRETVTSALLSLLKQGELDAAILALPLSEPDLREFALFEEDFVLVRPENEAGRAVPHPEDLSEMRLLLLEEGHCFRDQALSFCTAGGGVAQTRMEGSSLTTLVQMVAANMGVTLIPEISLSLEARSWAINVVRFPNPSPRRTIGMVWRKTTPMADELMQIGAIVRRAGVEIRDATRR